MQLRGPSPRSHHRLEVSVIASRCLAHYRNACPGSWGSTMCIPTQTAVCTCLHPRLKSAGREVLLPHMEVLLPELRVRRYRSRRSGKIGGIVGRSVAAQAESCCCGPGVGASGGTGGGRRLGPITDRLRGPKIVCHRVSSAEVSAKVCRWGLGLPRWAGDQHRDRSRRSVA